MIAMMVVTAGVVLLTLTLAAVAPTGGNEDDQAQRVLDRLIADERWTDALGVLRADDLDEVELGDEPFRGSRAVLQLDGTTIELFAHGDREGERQAASRAVNVSRGAMDVTAGTLTVWVWT